MSDQFAKFLSRLTPSAGTLDRDGLLFAAGRASVRPHRGWRTMAVLLASSQALSLAILWPHSNSPVAGIPGPMAVAPVPPSQIAPATFRANANPGVWSARRSLEVSDLEERPDATITFIESGPPLRAFGLPPESVLN